MKIIVVEPVEFCNKSAHNTLDSVGEGARVHTLADTALLTHGKPVFVPDWGGECKAVGCVAVRISRLGKSIPVRFASRYHDAVSVALKFELEGLKNSLMQAGRSWDVAESFDGAVSCGTFAEYGPVPEPAPLIGLKAGDAEMTFNFARMHEAIDEAIHTASNFMSIRQGDILLLPLGGMTFAARPNVHVEGFVDGAKLLEFNIK